MQPTTASPVNVQQLRQTAKQRYARGQGQRNLKGYSRLGKAALLSKLGLHDEARAHRSKLTRRKAIAFNATKEGGDSSVRKAQVKGRILRSIKRAMTAKEKSLGRELTQQEKRAIAAKALAVEAKAIRSGTPESKPKRGNAQNLKPAVKKAATASLAATEQPHKSIPETKRLRTLKDSLEKKQEAFDSRLDAHIQTVKQANGQPLNDKRNGQATLNKWEKQNQTLRNIQEGIKKTKSAIENEEGKIIDSHATKEKLPKEITSLLDSGGLVQWRKYPNTFFVEGVDKGRISWDFKKGVLSHKYLSSITDPEQRKKFAKAYNTLYAALGMGSGKDGK